MKLLYTPHGADPATIRLAFRTGFADHVKVLSGPAGDGLWVPSRLATKAKLKIGDPVSIDDFHSTVAAIYADQRDTRVDPDWWCSTSWLYAGRPDEGSSSPIPDLVLAPEAAVLAAESTIGSGSDLSNGVQIDRTVDVTGTTQSQGRHLAETIVAAQKKVVSGIIDDSRYTPNRMRSDLDPFTARSALVGSSVAPVIAALSVAGSGIGLLALASATSFWVRRRRRELIVLATHGVGTLSLGVKAVLETLPAIALGGLAGGVGAWLLIRDGGPSPLLDQTAVHRGILLAAAVLVLCLLVVVATAVAGARALIDVSPRRRQGSRWRHVPWELAVIAGAAALWAPLGSAHQSTLTGGQPYGAVASFPLRLFVTPPLILLGALILVVRLAVWWLSRSPGATARPVKQPPERAEEPQWQPAGPSWVVEAARSPARATAAPPG